jgi:hypothetical protein
MIRLSIPLILVSIFPASALAEAQSKVIYLWPKGAPGFEKLKDQPEEAKDWWVGKKYPQSVAHRIRSTDGTG